MNTSQFRMPLFRRGAMVLSHHSVWSRSDLDAGLRGSYHQGRRLRSRRRLHHGRRSGTHSKRGFGSFSKHYGLAAAGLLEAEVVTADGKVRIANACTNPDLFGALKGGGGGSFGVVSKLTLRVRELPEFCGGAIFTVKAASDNAFRRLIRRFVSFYQRTAFQRSLGRAGTRTA